MVMILIKSDIPVLSPNDSLFPDNPLLLICQSDEWCRLSRQVSCLGTVLISPSLSSIERWRVLVWHELGFQYLKSQRYYTSRPEVSSSTVLSRR